MNKDRRYTQAYRSMITVAFLVVILLLISACSSNGQTRTPNETEDRADASIESLMQRLNSNQPRSSLNGVNVTGTGTVNAKPDLAIISIGVETLASTVTQARDQAASAINAMVESFQNQGVEKADIETKYFNIQPEYRSEKVSKVLDNRERITRTVRKLVGYKVTNNLNVQIRNLALIGTILDDAIDKGGDATRLHNVSFTLESDKAIEKQARIAALHDAVKKADLYAENTGVKRGTLIGIEETTRSPFPKMARSMGAMESLTREPTSIIAGDLEVQITIHAVFAIDSN